MSGSPWTKQEIEQLKSEIERLTKDKVFYKRTRRQIVKEIAATMGKTEASIRTRLTIEGLSVGDRADKWSDSEIDQLRELAFQFTSEGKKLEDCLRLISKRLGTRTPEAVRTKLLRLGILANKCQRWTEEEKEFLLTRAGEIPFFELLERLNKWRRQQRKRPRTEMAVRRFLLDEGVSVRVCSDKCISLADLAVAMRCTQAKVRYWMGNPTYRKGRVPAWL
jgi:hypothetical protein